jgi:uncharacterized protein YbbK (DUF523 family)
VLKFAIRIGISSCLLGIKVRFDGQHKRDPILLDELGPLVEWVPVCPELEVGMGVPRESVRLVRRPRLRLKASASAQANPTPLMLGNSTGADWTLRMNRLARARARQLGAGDLAGYILKSNSPSCGMQGVALYASSEAGAAIDKNGVGLFAAELARQLPHLPMEEEGRLQEPSQREHFLARAFAYHELRDLWRTRWSRATLTAFHAAHEATLLAHAAESCRALGRWLARAKGVPRARLRDRYQSEFMAIMKQPPHP